MKNIPASIHARLVNETKRSGKPFNELLQHYGMERLLYRLSQTEFAGSFVLKGGLIFTAWDIQQRRSTRDIDLLGSLECETESIVQMLKAVVSAPVPEDGLFFDANTIQAEERLVDIDHLGISAKLLGYLDRAEIPIHIDIGFSDEILSTARELSFPTLLSGMERPRLKGYSPEFVISEKLHAMDRYATAPSRWKDYYDIWLISEYFEFDMFSLQEALVTTFKNRSTDLPMHRPMCLSAEFSLKHQTGWQNFLKKTALKTSGIENLSALVEELWKFLERPLIISEPVSDAKWNPVKRKWK